MNAADRVRVERIMFYATQEHSHPPDTWGGAIENSHTVEGEAAKLVNWRMAVARKMNEEYERMVQAIAPRM